jgi:hypothetical protein
LYQVGTARRKIIGDFGVASHRFGVYVIRFDVDLLGVVEQHPAVVEVWMIAQLDRANVTG